MHRTFLLALAALLVFQTAVLLAKYLGEVADGARFGGDFIVFYEAAKQAASGNIQAIYRTDKIDGADIADMAKKIQTASGETIALAPFVYPPHALFALRSLAEFSSYGSAAVFWSVISLVAFYVTLFLHIRHFPAPALAIMVALPLPLLLGALFSGQTSMLVAALFLAAAFFLPTRPMLAGVLIGCMSIKPQLGLLVPVALLAAGQIRAFFAAALTTLSMLALATLWLGISIWSDYIYALRYFSDFVATGFERIVMLPLSPYLSLRLLGVGPLWANLLQGMVTLALAVWIWKVFRPRDPMRLDLRLGILACAVLLATPYALGYDMPILALALVPLIGRIWTGGFSGGLEIAALTLTLAAIFLQPLLVPYGLPVACPALFLLFTALTRRYRAEATKIL